MVMFKYEELENIKNNIKDKFKLKECHLSEKDKLKLVLTDNLSNDKMEEIAIYCKNELEKVSKKFFKFNRCKVSKKQLCSNNSQYIFYFIEIEQIKKFQENL